MVVACTPLLGLGGCTDTPIETPARPAQPASTPGDAGAERVFSLFSLELATRGPITVGQPIQLEARVKANAAAEDVRIRLVLPEVQTARLSGVGERFRLVRDTRFDAHMDAVLDLAAGEQVRRSTHVQVPGPGYYRAVLSAEGQSSAGISEGQRVQPFASREIWLAVSEQGVQVTGEFDASRVPAGMRAQPGPYRPLLNARRTSGANAGPGTVAFDYTPPPEGDGQWNGAVWYYDDYYGMYKTVPGVEVTYTYFVYDYNGWEYVDSQSYLSSQYGSINYHCNLDGVTRQRLEVDVALWSSNVYVPGAAFHDVISSCSQLPQDYDIVLPKHHTRVFLNRNRSVGKTEL